MALIEAIESVFRMCGCDYTVLSRKNVDQTNKVGNKIGLIRLFVVQGLKKCGGCGIAETEERSGGEAVKGVEWAPVDISSPQPPSQCGQMKFCFSEPALVMDLGHQRSGFRCFF